ncbi:MAG: hypothetical protein KBG80_00585 [Breznakibacter sp.]|nr:hypothetical protein [Breznakibacter sp.]
MDNQPTPLHFRANGKILITSEYLVLHGAKALALPLKYGQTLTVESNDSKELEWIANLPDKNWFRVKFDSKLAIVEASNNYLAEATQKLIEAAVIIGKLNTFDFIGKRIITQLDFQKDWGFGSSSTILSLIAQWLKIDPFKLLEITFGGSGYDIACATSFKPIIYQLENNKPTYSNTIFNPKYSDNIFFFYLGQKQKSYTEVIKYSKIKPNPEIIIKANQLTEHIINAPFTSLFQEYILQHEALIASYTNLPSINELIPIKDVVLKSLGAWGGDFAMAVSSNPQQAKIDLAKLGYNIQFSFNELALY